ncbi:MAG TPA: GNAT family N-acetyltransferase [Burkholderiaceae bacterium]|nr:GNAT family N-acetyltransferase [Burkholderiaceae bacterium]
MLRPYRPGDGKALFTAIDANREDLKSWLAWVDEHRTVDDSEAYVRTMAGRWVAREALILAIWDGGGDYCGGAGFHGFDWRVPSFELGYFLQPGARGRGFATEAVNLLTSWARKELNARRIWASCDRANEASWKVLERCGFRREAHLLKERVDHHGRLRDTFIYALTD